LRIASTALVLLILVAAESGAATDPCAYAYWPSATGLERDYTYVLRTTISGQPPRESTSGYTIAITSRSRREVTVRTVVHPSLDNPNPVNGTYQARCTAKGPEMLPSRQGGTAVRYRGVEVPARITAQTTWTRDMMVSEGSSPPVIRTTYRALGREAVTVPAGRFEAWKVAFEIRGRGKDGGTYPVTTGTQWLARGVGPVRYVSVITSDAGGARATMETTHELAAVREGASNGLTTRGRRFRGPSEIPPDTRTPAGTPACSTPRRSRGSGRESAGSPGPGAARIRPSGSGTRSGPSPGRAAARA
jgi:hypothetical protein